MKLKHLEQVLEICRCGSFSGAARRLKVTQPTLSKSIAKLEAQLNLQLFEREGGSAQPTDYGLFVAEKAEDVLDSVRAITHDLKLFARGEAGQLRIGISGGTRLKPVPEVIHRIAKQFPNLQVETRNELAPALVSGVRASLYDLVFCTSEVAGSEGDLIRIKLFEDRHVLIAPAGHPVLKDLPLTPEKILRYRLASFGLVSSLKSWAGDVSLQARRNLTAFVSGESSLIKSRVFESEFIGFGPKFAFAEELRKGSLIELPVQGLANFECWMLTTESRWRSPLIKAVAEIAKSAAKSSNKRFDGVMDASAQRAIGKRATSVRRPRRRAKAQAI